MSSQSALFYALIGYCAVIVIVCGVNVFRATPLVICMWINMMTSNIDRENMLSEDSHLKTQNLVIGKCTKEKSYMQLYYLDRLEKNTVILVICVGLQYYLTGFK